jgi:probable F420-dependent oxidoreductase
VSRAVERPIRFGVGASVSTVAEIAAAAREAEAVGYSTFAVADHFGTPYAPLVALTAAAAATESLRLTTTVLAHDFRHPAVLAKELATLDVLSDGRVEIGIGAGWLRSEYEQTGIAFDRPAERIDRLEEYLTVLKGLMADGPCTHTGEHFAIRGLDGTPKSVQRPHPPILIGGGGRKILGLAGRVADIVSVIGANRHGRLNLDLADFAPSRLEEKIGWVREGAGDRFDDIELNITLLGVELADDPKAGVVALKKAWAPRLAAMGRREELTEQDIVDCPLFVAGTIEDMCDQLIALRELFGISYFSIASGASEATNALVSQLT